MKTLITTLTFIYTISSFSQVNLSTGLGFGFPDGYITGAAKVTLSTQIKFILVDADTRALFMGGFYPHADLKAGPIINTGRRSIFQNGTTENRAMRIAPMFGIVAGKYSPTDKKDTTKNIPFCGALKFMFQQKDGQRWEIEFFGMKRVAEVTISFNL